MTNLEKGNRLEEAVRRIETSIIQSVPGYSEAKFQIESKKIIKVQGVRHEIDIWVTARIAAGYQSVFIFECRNREEKVGKNDIIVFSEKVRAANAAKGFFVAKAFTQDALAQVALNPRIEAIVAEELNASSINFRAVPFRTNFREDKTHVGIFTGVNAPRVFPMELPLAYCDERMPLGRFFGRWAKQCEDVFPALDLPGGEYPYAIESTLDFVRHEAFLAGIELTGLGLLIEGIAVLERAAVVSAFDVASRGRTISYEFNGPLNYPNGLVVDTGPIHMTWTPLSD